MVRRRGRAETALIGTWIDVCKSSGVKSFLSGCAMLFTLGGCLSSNYQLSHAELVRLTHIPPPARGARVRVLQQAAFNADDVSAEDLDREEEDTPSSSPSSLRFEVSVSDEDAPQSGGPSRLEHGGVGSGSSGHDPWHFGHPSPVHGSAGHARVSSSGGSPAGIGGGGGGGGAGEAIVVAVVAVVVANAVGVALASVEGRRFDGWARVQPDAPVVLVAASSTQVVPLSALTERDVARADHAVLVDRDASVSRWGRAPLDRKGFAYELELGGARLNTATGVRDFAFASRTGIGYFPTQTIGFLLADQVAFSEHGDEPKGGAVFNGRIAGELEYLPIHAGRIHAGAYAELGGALALEDLPDKTLSWSGIYASAGFLAQIDWTTRLSLNWRGGIASLPAYPGGDALDRSYVPELTFGISVY